MKILNVQKVYKNFLSSLTEIFINNSIIPMGGTALGCVRHSGFIPWDDDLDFFIRPRDFKKIIISKELNIIEPFSKNNSLGFAKIILPNYISFEKHLKKENYSFCSIDLMIMCEASTKFSAIIKFYFLKFITLIGVIDRRYNLNLLINPLRIIGKNLLLREVRKPKFIFHSTGKAGLKNGLYDFNFFKIDGFIKFENLNLLNYKGIKEYLKKRYGDSFMQLPSENVKRKYKSHTSGFAQFKDIKFLIDGVGVLWKMNEFKKGLLVKNKNIDNFLSCINTQVIICTNIPYKLNNANFEIYTTEQKFSKLEDEYFTKLISDFKLKKDKVIYVEHSKKVCKFASKYFEVINWDESKDSVDSFYFDLLKTINKKVVY